MKTYLVKRVIVISLILFGFIFYGLFFIENNKSCIGNPKILPTFFIGLPIVFSLLIIDSIIIFFKKEKRKYIKYLFITYFLFALLIILFFRDW
jgi:phosphatidylserine synthase